VTLTHKKLISRKIMKRGRELTDKWFSLREQEEKICFHKQTTKENLLKQYKRDFMKQIKTKHSDSFLFQQLEDIMTENNYFFKLKDNITIYIGFESWVCKIEGKFYATGGDKVWESDNENLKEYFGQITKEDVEKLDEYRNKLRLVLEDPTDYCLKEIVFKKYMQSK
jgi:hypothetical protein